MLNKIFGIIICMLLSSCFAGKRTATYPVIPYPASLKSKAGFFILTKETSIVDAKNNFTNESKIFNAFLDKRYGFTLNVQSQSSPANFIELIPVSKVNQNSESYEMKIESDKIQISGTPAGIFYAFQTLKQLLSVDSALKIPCAVIKDSPRFQWRGMHLDVARHFFTVDEIKKYIDYIAMYKMNTFHWHLTEDQGWRIEIKKYPRLTEVGAWRNGTLIGHYGEIPPRYDSVRYGGFYTQEQIKDVVAFAAERHIAVVPEIEMPGHSLAALASYPELSCTGGPFEVGKTWGVFEDVYCPKEETFRFLEDVLSEVCELFPSKYIHIGGDECPKVRWKNCADCQALMKKEGLKDEHELQSYFISRIEKFLNSKGKQIIGWDEILEGGLAPNAAVMSWRGTDGGIAAAKQNHDVVMTPTGYCYFDYYQSLSPYEPLCIGGYLPVEKVYSFEPVPNSLSAKQQKHILGTQGNIWSEYFPTFHYIEHNIFPRICALAEVAWTPKKEKDADDFISRLPGHFKLLDKMNVNYSKGVYDITATTTSTETNKGVLVTLSSKLKNVDIRYAFDTTPVNAQSEKYIQPITITKNTTLKGALFSNGIMQGYMLEQPYHISKATGKKITLAKNPAEQYSNGGVFTLVNGIAGRLPWNGADWLGFWGGNLDAVIDLGESDTISRITVDALDADGSWIHLPKSVTVSFSDDGKMFQNSSTLAREDIQKMKRELVMIVPQTKARFIKVVAENSGIIPDGKPGAGYPAWLFVDEIVVE